MIDLGAAAVKSTNLSRLELYQVKSYLIRVAANFSP